MIPADRFTGGIGHKQFAAHERLVGEVLVLGAFELALEARGLWRDRGLTLGGRQGPGFFPGGLLACVDGRGVAADVPGDLVAVAGFDHRLLNALRQLILGEGAREGGFAGNLAERLPSAEAA